MRNQPYSSEGHHLDVRSCTDRTFPYRRYIRRPLAVRAAEAEGTAPMISDRKHGTLLDALHAWRRTHPEAEHINSLDLTAMANARGLRLRSRRQAAIGALVARGHLQPAVGGFCVHL